MSNHTGATTVMGKYYEQVVKTLPCPTCGAKIGETCKTGGAGTRTHKPHAARLNQKR